MEDIRETIKRQKKTQELSELDKKTKNLNGKIDDLKENGKTITEEFTGKPKKPEPFLELLPKLDIDDISFYYRQFTGKKRSHTRGAKTTKNYMINEIIKVLKQSKL